MRYSAAVFVFRDQLVVCASPMTDAGIRTIGQVTAQSRTVDRHSLGLLVQQALLASLRTSAAPTAEDYQPLLDATASATLKECLIAASMAVAINASDSMVTVALLEKPKQGNEVRFSTVGSPFSAASRTDIGDAVVQMLEAKSAQKG